MYFLTVARTYKSSNRKGMPCSFYNDNTYNITKYIINRADEYLKEYQVKN